MNKTRRLSILDRRDAVYRVIEGRLYTMILPTDGQPGLLINEQAQEGDDIAIVSGVAYKDQGEFQPAVMVP